MDGDLGGMLGRVIRGGDAMDGDGGDAVDDDPGGMLWMVIRGRCCG